MEDPDINHILGSLIEYNIVTVLSAAKDSYMVLWEPVMRENW